MASLEKILYVSPKFPEVSMVFEQNEILGIQKNGIDVTVLSCRRISKSDLTKMHDFARPILDYTIHPNYKDVLYGVILSLIRSPKAFIKVILYLITALGNPFAIPKTFAAFLLSFGWYPVLSRERYDWIHADFGKGSATVALILSTLLDCQFSFKVHAFDIYDRSLIYLDLLKTVKVKQAGLIFSEHEYGRGVLSKSAGGYEEKIKVNYTSVRTGDFLPLEPQLGSKRFVALGRLVPKKGFAVLVKAVTILINSGERLIVDIYGSGPEAVSLNKMIHSKGLQNVIHLKGMYKNDDLPKLLSDSLAIIVPSVMDKSGDMDGVPTVIYEAMALGRAVIASRISGIPEIVHNDINGYLVNPGDPVQLADRMSQILENPQMCLAMGNEGRRLVEKNHEYILNANALIGAIDDFLHLQK